MNKSLFSIVLIGILLILGAASFAVSNLNKANKVSENNGAQLITAEDSKITNTSKDFYLIKSAGEVMYKLPNEDYKSLDKDEIGLPYNTYIKTNNKGEAHIILANNSVITLAPDTELQVENNDNKSQINQIVGRTWHRIQKLTSEEEYEVKTDTAIAAVRGTIFLVEVKNNNLGKKVSEISLLEGKIECTQLTKEDGKEIEKKKETITPNTTVTIADFKDDEKWNSRTIPQDKKDDIWFKENMKIDENIKKGQDIKKEEIKELLKQQGSIITLNTDKELNKDKPKVLGASTRIIRTANKPKNTEAKKDTKKDKSKDGIEDDEDEKNDDNKDNNSNESNSSNNSNQSPVNLPTTNNPVDIGPTSNSGQISVGTGVTPPNTGSSSVVVVTSPPPVGTGITSPTNSGGIIIPTVPGVGIGQLPGSNNGNGNTNSGGNTNGNPNNNGNNQGNSGGINIPNPTGNNGNGNNNTPNGNANGQNGVGPGNNGNGNGNASNGGNSGSNGNSSNGANGSAGGNTPNSGNSNSSQGGNSSGNTTNNSSSNSNNNNSSNNGNSNGSSGNNSSNGGGTNNGNGNNGNGNSNAGGNGNSNRNNGQGNPNSSSSNPL